MKCATLSDIEVRHVCVSVGRVLDAGGGVGRGLLYVCECEVRRSGAPLSLHTFCTYVSSALSERGVHDVRWCSVIVLAAGCAPRGRTRRPCRMDAGAAATGPALGDARRGLV